MNKTDVRYIKGVGPGNAALLEKIGIRTVEEMFAYLPFRTEDRRNYVSARELTALLPSDDSFFVAGTVKKITGGKSPYKRAQVIEIIIEDKAKTGNIRLLAFKNRVKYILAVLETGQEVAVYGKVELLAEGLTLNNFDFEIIKPGDNSLSFFRMTPVYRLTKGISSKRFRRWMWNALEKYAEAAEEFIPEAVRKRLALPPRAEIFRNAHFPDSLEAQAASYRRIKFEEFFVFECAIAYNRARIKKTKKPLTYKLKKNLLTPWKESLPFVFTSGQKKAINDIFRDMLSPYPMNRLLQGDVGCGKTVVAASAAVLAKENLYQTAILAPTQTLAEQHFKTFSALLKESRVRTVLLTGGMKKEDRKKTLEEISAGKADIVIGTHALLQENVKFKNLSLIIIDEQQRFGVHQKAALSAKGRAPDILVLTATPIPRALSLALFGDLDRSEIRSLPPGRKKVETIHGNSQEAYELIRRQIEAGFQAFVVYPCIEENETQEDYSAKAAHKYLSEEVFPDYKVTLLHGRMSPAAKNAAMEKFSSGKTDILVSTTVIEVGVDIPRATVMLIENAQMYGLGTLHQLRGRIGRGGEKSYCIVTSPGADALATQRISYFLKSSDGFELAEKDLELRGAGQYFGTAQHGLMDISFNYNKTLEEKFPHLSDIAILNEARQEAFPLIKNDPGLLKNKTLKTRIMERFSEGFNLAKVS
ncbi:ATP-dependent DNA helicase RecG [bacterium]|nr:ATP-dependent DNA helicase RecG [bacterium]MBU3956437.1 ATP-dependent DNA helicase RecG [bacterium]